VGARYRGRQATGDAPRRFAGSDQHLCGIPFRHKISSGFVSRSLNLKLVPALTDVIRKTRPIPATAGARPTLTTSWSVRQPSEMRILIGMVGVAGVIGVLDLLALDTGTSPELRASQPAANAAKVASLDCDEAHFRTTLATLDTQLYSVAPREHIVAPASKLKTDRLTVRQLQVGEMYVPHATYQVGEMDMPMHALQKVAEMDRAAPKRAMEVAEMDRVAPKRAMEVAEMDMAVKRAMEVAEMDMAVKRAMEVAEMDMRVRRTMEVAEMDMRVKRPMQVSEMDMRVRRTLEVAEMDMSSHPTKASAMDVSPQFAVVQGVLDRLQ